LKIDINFDNIESIAHIADIHIRNLKRHDEYRNVFKKLYKNLKETLPEKSLIYLAGDIVHAKTEMSPELIQMVSELFTNLSKIRPTILIAGNHDCNLNNANRLDALTPIVDTLDLDNFYYLKDTGVYTIADIDFAVMSVFDDPENYIKAKDIKGSNKKIALYHGCVSESQTDAGFRLPGDVETNIFDGYDYTLLGDIHKYQYLNKSKNVAYAGSLVCQNFGEHPTNHGYLLWDMINEGSEFIKIRNDQAYYTLDIIDGKLPDLSEMPKRPRLRIKLTNTDEPTLKKLLTIVRKKCKLKDITVLRNDRLSQAKIGNRDLKNGIGDVRNVSFQNELIKDYLDRNYVVDENIIKSVFKINKDLNGQMQEAGIARNLRWKPIKFTFDNMFSYASDNEINFENFSGTYGLFAPNASGKSALLDAICFCLFDRCSRTSSANDVMNNKKNDFCCRLQYRIDGQDYFIERKAHRVLKGYHSGKVTVKVNFWTIENGQEVSLNGEQRYDTNKNIRNHVGSYDDFILTTLSVQNNNTAFIEKSQSERKDLLAQFLDISVFEELYSLANNEIKGVSAILDEFKKTDFTQQMADADAKIEENRNLNIEAKKEKTSAANKLKTLEKRISKNENKLIEIGQVNEDIDGLEINLKSEESKVNNIKERLKGDEETSRKNKKILAETCILLSKLGNIENIKNGNNKYLEAEKSHNKISNEIEKIKIIVKNKLEKLKHLDKHEYDPNCKYCINNPFVQDAKKTEADLETDKIKAKRLINILDIANDEMVDNKRFSCAISEVNDYNLTIQQIETERNNGRIDYYRAKEKLGKTEKVIEQICIDISKYHQNKKDIINNQKIKDVLKDLSDNKIILDVELEAKEEELLTIHGSIEVALNTKKTILDSIGRAESLQDKYKAYEYYLDAIQRDGVPYELISKIIPIVEDEVNDILNRIVEFNIIFNLDGKNINTYITYGDDKVWPLELTSGMEKFISSIAIRTALINISNLSRPNFLAIDEGLGNLDSENLNSMFMLFEYLKSQFEFLMVISHLESVRDVVDNLIDIKKESGFSKVIY